MKVLQAVVPESVVWQLQELLRSNPSREALNAQLRKLSGIVDFFDNEADFHQLQYELTDIRGTVEEHNTVAYGDFQTNASLANRVCEKLSQATYRPTVLLEPTCGQGNFILAALAAFPTLQTVYGIEIYKPYLYQCKFNILQYYNTQPHQNRPAIHLMPQSIFDVAIEKLVNLSSLDELLLLGNPPWVTNATLGAMSSDNLPTKTNFKQHTGLDALTGKSNFDIAEYITLQLLRHFQHQRGHIALLIKNTVIRNIVQAQRSSPLRIGDLQQQTIDAKREFNVSVDASLFSATLQTEPTLACVESSFDDKVLGTSTFGWVNEKFVSNCQAYEELAQFDGRCPYEWRQGIKHDCSSVMELSRQTTGYGSAVESYITLEEDLVYPLYKSSDLQQPVAAHPRKFVIVPQERIGQDTAYIKTQVPITFQYLQTYRDRFDRRKSSIYRNKPPFSIFGVGDYSFKPYKVAISGLYKNACFTLVPPVGDKPAMLDDTCYFLGFDDIVQAVCTLIALNHPTTIRLLKAITFSDAKRVYTKDLLMRIDIRAIACTISFDEAMEVCPPDLRQYVNCSVWQAYGQVSQQLGRNQIEQLVLF